MSRSACWLLVCAALVVTIGCNRGPRLVPVTGVVKMKDGSVPKGIIMSINFSPADGPGGSGEDGPRPASGEIDKNDGSFKLKTQLLKGPKDGVIEGTYKATVTILKSYPPPQGGGGVVDKKYENFENTPLQYEIAPGKNEHIEIEVEPIKARGGKRS